MSITKASIAFGLVFTAFGMLNTANAALFGTAADVSFYRPDTGVWYSRSFSEPGAFRAVRIGSSADIPVPGDYDGDGYVDEAVWQSADGIWLINRSSDGKRSSINSLKTSKEAVPVPGDYDGDGTTDIAVWEPATGEWKILLSSKSGKGSRPLVLNFGRKGDVPVQEDYDGDGKTDIAYFRPSENRWHIRESDSGKTVTEVFGFAGQDLLVPGDYTGDGKADIAVFRNGNWLLINSNTKEQERFDFGFVDSIPAPADYDGDGTLDFAVYRRGMWYIQASKGPEFIGFEFGGTDDIPVGSLRAKQSFVAV
ncbi:MAG: VCBS repeat-containing protein [Acidobacteria bacterium]|nr:VCBS repeat-containing protein [Acidobacteriota bacterium]